MLTIAVKPYKRVIPFFQKIGKSREDCSADPHVEREVEVTDPSIGGKDTFRSVCRTIVYDEDIRLGQTTPDSVDKLLDVAFLVVCGNQGQQSHPV
jgi:hypothetical protein